MLARLLGKAVATGALCVVIRQCVRALRRLRASRLGRLSARFDIPVDRSAVFTVKHGLASALHGEAAEGALKLWLADMDLPGCDAIRAALERRASHPTYGYTYQPPQLWNAVARWLREQHDWDVPIDSLVFTPSVVTGFATALAAYTQPGDRVLVMTPLYEPLQAAVTGMGRVLVCFALREEGGAAAGGDAAAGGEDAAGGRGCAAGGQTKAGETAVGGREVAGGGRCAAGAHDRELQLDLRSRLEPLLPTIKLLLLCSPHNPAGRVWRKAELVSLADACARHGVLILEDAIWADWCLWGHPFIPFASAAAQASSQTGKPPCQRVTLGAPSKSWNLGGLHAAWVQFSDEALRQSYLAQAEPAALTFGSAFATEGMAAAYTHGGPWLSRAKIYVQENLDFVTGYLRAHVPEIEVLIPQATYLLWLDCSGLGFGSAAGLNAFMLKEARLLLSSGDSFAPGSL